MERPKCEYRNRAAGQRSTRRSAKNHNRLAHSIPRPGHSVISENQLLYKPKQVKEIMLPQLRVSPTALNRPSQPVITTDKSYRSLALGRSVPVDGTRTFD